jgi:hypothetical protein
MKAKVIKITNSTCGGCGSDIQPYALPFAGTVEEFQKFVKEKMKQQGHKEIKKAA